MPIWSIWISQHFCVDKPTEQAVSLHLSPTNSANTAQAVWRWWGLYYLLKYLLEHGFRNLATNLVANEKQKLQNNYELRYIYHNIISGDSRWCCKTVG